MGCTMIAHSAFLCCANIILLFTGICILSLGIRIKNMVATVYLDKIPSVLQTANAIITAGFFIILTAGSGCTGAWYELFWLIGIHLGALGLIIMIEFGTGIALILLKNTVENFMNSGHCGQVCNITLQAVVVDCAMPAAVMIFIIIIVQAVMMYSGVQLFFFFHTKQNLPTRTQARIVHDLPMQNVVGQRHTRSRHFGQSIYPQPLPEHEEPYQPSTEYVSPVRNSPAYENYESEHVQESATTAPIVVGPRHTRSRLFGQSTYPQPLPEHEEPYQPSTEYVSPVRNSPAYENYESEHVQDSATTAPIGPTKDISSNNEYVNFPPCLDIKESESHVALPSDLNSTSPFSLCESNESNTLSIMSPSEDIIYSRTSISSFRTSPSSFSYHRASPQQRRIHENV